MKHYNGWTYDFDPGRPVTGQWRATRYGVGLCTNSEDALKRMIDVKNSERLHPVTKFAANTWRNP